LATAAYFGHMSVVQLLGEGAADTNHADADGVTALHCAAQSKNPEIVRYLPGKGADRNAKDSGGKTPADWARQAGDREIEGLLMGTASKP
jgi:ankyrin repeat protein